MTTKLTLKTIIFCATLGISSLAVAQSNNGTAGGGGGDYIYTRLEQARAKALYAVTAVNPQAIKIDSADDKSLLDLFTQNQAKWIAALKFMGTHMTLVEKSLDDSGPRMAFTLSTNEVQFSAPYIRTHNPTDVELEVNMIHEAGRIVGIDGPQNNVLLDKIGNLVIGQWNQIVAQQGAIETCYKDYMTNLICGRRSPDDKCSLTSEQAYAWVDHDYATNIIHIGPAIALVTYNYAIQWGDKDGAGAWRNFISIYESNHQVLGGVVAQFNFFILPHIILPATCQGLLKLPRNFLQAY